MKKRYRKKEQKLQVILSETYNLPLN